MTAATMSSALPTRLQLIPSLAFLVPRWSTPTELVRTRSFALFSRQLSHPLVPTLSLSIPSVRYFDIPSLLPGLWDSVLRAVPKKKTSHMKKRHRQMAGKALKDVTALNKCSACGKIKRAHLLCPYCVQDIRDMWRGKSNGPEEMAKADR